MLNVDALIAEATFEPFRFVLDGEERQLPHLQTLDGDTLRRITVAPGFIAILDAIAGDELGERLRRLPLHAAEAIATAWNAHCGVTPGESQASSDS